MRTPTRVALAQVQVQAAAEWYRAGAKSRME